MRRLLKRGEAGLYPGAHHALGLTAYTQVTSPLRRYQDLSMHRQIVAVLAGLEPEYDAAAMQALLASTERAESEGKLAPDGGQLLAVLAGVGVEEAAPATRLGDGRDEERAESEGKRAERAMDRYYMMRWLERSVGGTLTGVVVDVVPRPIVVLDETLMELAVPSLVGAAKGDRVRLKVERVNPRADLLVLRPA